jgi:hypothetical protein
MAADREYTTVAVEKAVSSTTFVGFDEQPCFALDIVNANSSAVAIRWRIAGTTVSVPIAAGSAYLVTGIRNANQVQIARDSGSGSVTVQAVARI